LEPEVSFLISRRYHECHNWEEVSRWAVAENILQSRTINTAKRVSAELIYRLKMLNDDELSNLVEASFEERKIWLWIAICRAYRLVREFAVEVVRERYLSGDMTPLSLGSFDAFFEQKSAIEPIMAEISSSTCAKIRQKTFQLLTEAGIITDAKVVSGMIVGEKILHSIPSDERDWFPVFIKG
jgi:hypothetical protein